MTRYIMNVGGKDTSDLEELIDNSTSKNLIKELNFKYDYQVISALKPPEIYNDKTIKYLMGRADGFALATVWTEGIGTELTYCYRSPYYRKERGSDSADREILRSKKLSALMATLKRHDVIPDKNFMLKNLSDQWTYSAHLLEKSLGSHEKHRGELDIEDLHDLLRKVVGESPNTLDLNKCQLVLDKYDEADRIKVKKQEEVSRFYDKEFYCVGADDLDNLIIGTVKRVKMDKPDRYTCEVIKPFKRTLAMPEELQAVMLMSKVALEDRYSKFYANYIPRYDGYDSNLDIVFTSNNSRIDEYKLTWALIPCSTI